MFSSFPQNVLSTHVENTILSPFLVKLLLSMLGEAAGERTTTRRELQSVLPSIQSSLEARELYGKAFGSMLVSLRAIAWAKKAHTHTHHKIKKYI